MNTFKAALKFFIFMAILTGVIYPVAITLIAQSLMPWRANGSLLLKGDKIIGSELIAQKTEGDRYFWPRPSAIDYDPMKPSGGSNYGPTSKKLKDQVKERMVKFGDKAPADLLYASASGLDPHISTLSAYYQIPRVAKARSINEAELKKLVDSQIEHREYINVLLLNQALDK